MPEHMFSPIKGGCSNVISGGIHGLGLGLAQRPELLEIRFFDIYSECKWHIAGTYY
jgi:mitofusin 2